MDQFHRDLVRLIVILFGPILTAGVIIVMLLTFFAIVGFQS